MSAPPSAVRGAKRTFWDTSTDGLVLLSPNGMLLDMNPAALALHAFADSNDARARLAEVHTRFTFKSENGRVLPFAETPVGRVLSGETFSHQIVEVTQNDLMRSWWGSFAGSVLPALNKTDAGLRVLSIRDITKEMRAQIAETSALKRDLQIYQIGQTLRRAKNSDAIRRTAVQILGETLGADRCYFVTYHTQNDTVNIGPDWKASGETSPASRLYPFRANPLNLDAAYGRGETQIVSDVLTHPLVVASGEAMPNPPTVRAVLRVPLNPGTLDAALTVVMRHAPRKWTEGEIIFAEKVAAQTRLALADAFVRERDSRIATQLQEALLPVLPAALPGLFLGGVYRAALAESAIGGDFYDVFSPAPDKTVLVIGDVSGKGIEAATQVSAVRNMLRATVGTCATLAEAVTLLNRLLTDQNLLQHFATLFVCLHDRHKKTLSWVSCGHEPALLWVAQIGAVVSLDADGIPLGIEPGAVFHEKTVPFAQGDALLLYTDGLSEAGPNRAEMLQTGGVSRLFLRALHARSRDENAAPNQAAAMARALFDEAAAFAHGGLHDDVCLFLAQATE